MLHSIIPLLFHHLLSRIFNIQVTKFISIPEHYAVYCKERGLIEASVKPAEEEADDEDVEEDAMDEEVEADEADAILESDPDEEEGDL